MMDIEAQILTLPESQPDWLARCLASLVGQPARITLHAGIPGHVGAARRRAWEAATGEWVTWIDPDDEVLPGAFEVIQQAIQQHPGVAVIFTDEEVVDEQGRLRRHPPRPPVLAAIDLQRSPVIAHHLVVVRRTALLAAAADLPAGLALLQWAATAVAAHRGGCVHIPVPGYRWYDHRNGIHHRMAADVREARRAIQERCLRH